MSTLGFRSDWGPEPDRERDGLSRPDLQLIATRDELEAVRAQLDGAQVELRALRSQVQSSAVVRETLDIERTRAARAETALESERERANVAVAAIAEAQQRTAAALQELNAERQDVAALRNALAQARAAASSTGGVTLASGPTWDGAAQRAVAEAIAEVADWRVALKEIVRVIGPHGSWDAVVAWAPEERRSTLSCLGMWTGADPALRELETKTWQTRRNPMAAEFGMARSSEGAVCLPDLESAEDRLLHDAFAAGMNTAVLVPIRTGQETIGVLELWSRRSGLPDDDVVLFLEAVALQLGSHAGLINAAAAPRWRVGRY